MKLEEYAAQQAQQAHEAPQAAANQLDAIRAQLDAEKLSLLLAEAQQIIDESGTAAAMLTRIVAAMFGDDSAEAQQVAAAIEKENAPGGHELAIAEIRNRRKLIKQQAKQLEEHQKALAAELEQLNTAEREQLNQRAEAGELNGALIDTLTFCMNPQANQLRELYNRHHDCPAAMGLLYGSITDMAQYTGGKLDLVQLQEFADMKAQILEAANGQARICP